REALEIDRHHAAKRGSDRGLDAAAHAGAAAERDGGDLGRAAPVEQRRDLALGLGKRHQIRRLAKVAGDRAHQVAIRAAVAVERALGAIVRADARERARRRDAWCAKLAPIEGGWLAAYDLWQPQ